MTDDVCEVSRQQQIEKLDIGDSVSVSRRLEILPPNKITEYNKQIRGVIDKQAHRARQRFPRRQYKVENGSFMTREGAIILVAVCTRIE